MRKSKFTDEQIAMGLRQAATEEAEAATRAKSGLLSRTSHELRTPLNAILGFGQLLETDLKDPADQESVGQIMKAGRHLLSLVDELLDIAGADSQELTLSLEATDLRQLVGEALSRVRSLAQQYEVALPRSNPVREGLMVLAHRERLTQVFLHLLSNAVQYNRAGGSVEVECQESGTDRLRIEIRDTGAGIAPEQLPRLFQPFDRLDAEKTSATTATGTGLGLARSRALMEAMGAEIGAESTPGEGSTFWIELQIAEPMREAEPVGSAPRRVLYVEDAPANVRLVERIFRRSRPELELITARDGRAGLEIAREQRPDLILLDLNLPDLPGEEVLRALQEEEVTRRIPVVMISGDVSPQQIERLLALGAVQYLTKPFPIPAFLALLDEMLGRAEA